MLLKLLLFIFKKLRKKKRNSCSCREVIGREVVVGLGREQNAYRWGMGCEK
jgi:hypothetical protein